MSLSIKKRLVIGAGALTTVAAAATLMAGVTFGLFSANSGNQNDTFTAGTLTIGAPVITSCTIPATVVPGDSGTCSFKVTTGGSEAANVAIDVAVAPGPSEPVASVPQAYNYAPSVNAPASGLYDALSNAFGLQVTLSSTDGVTPVSSYDLSGLSRFNSSTTNLFTAPAVTPGTTETYTLHWSLPVDGGVDNNYQGASSTFTFDVHSVQSANNTDATTPGSISSGSWS